MSSWTELIGELYKDSWDAEIGRHRSPVVFRGLNCATNDLSSSLMRLGQDRDSLARLEVHLLRNFRKYAHANAAAGDSVWNWLALAAHHGLPTRLLDWTYSPFVALHFASCDLRCYDRDGVVWCLNHRETNRWLPPSLRSVADAEGSNVFTVDMMLTVADTLEKLERLSEEEFLLFLEPPSLDARIVNQFALFSLFSSPAKAVDDWLHSHSELSRRILIPAEMKWEVRDKLDQAGITERMLFPGLDGLSKWLARYYTPRQSGD